MYLLLWPSGTPVLQTMLVTQPLDRCPDSVSSMVIVVIRIPCIFILIFDLQIYFIPNFILFITLLAIDSTILSSDIVPARRSLKSAADCIAAETAWLHSHLLTVARFEAGRQCGSASLSVSFMSRITTSMSATLSPPRASSVSISNQHFECKTIHVTNFVSAAGIQDGQCNSISKWVSIITSNVGKRLTDFFSTAGVQDGQRGHAFRFQERTLSQSRASKTATRLDRRTRVDQYLEKYLERYVLSFSSSTTTSYPIYKCLSSRLRRPLLR